MTSSSGSPAPILVEGPDDEPELDPTAATVVGERPPAAVLKGPLRPGFSARSRRAGAIGGVLAVGLLALVVAAVDRGPWGRSPQVPLAKSPSDALAAAQATRQPPPPAVAPSEADTVEINVAYGTEKQQWLEGATAEFQKTSADRSIKVNLHGMGSMEGARVVLDGPKPVPFQVWSPASDAYRDAFEQEWRAEHENKPIWKSDNLALTPMVFVMWADRREAFIKKYAKQPGRARDSDIPQRDEPDASLTGTSGSVGAQGSNPWGDPACFLPTSPRRRDERIGGGKTNRVPVSFP